MATAVDTDRFDLRTTWMSNEIRPPVGDAGPATA
jgi:hypothetical protein